MLRALMLRPAAACSVAFAAGVAAAAPGAALAAAAGGTLLLPLALRGAERSKALLGAALCLSFAAGAWRADAAFRRLPPGHYARTVPSGPVRFEAEIDEDPRTLGGEREEGPARRMARGRILRIAPAGRRPAPCEGRTTLLLPPEPPLSAGDRIEGEGRLFAREGPTNPGEPDFAASRRRAGEAASLAVDAVEPVRRAEGLSASRLRASLSRLLEDRLDPETAAFLSALLLGVRSELSADLRADFQESGTVHFLAISGMHVVFLLGAFSWPLRILIPPVRARAAALIALAFGYGWLVGFAPSVSRAVILAAVYLGAELSGRPRDLLTTLAIAFAAVVAADPAQLFLPGCQLSFLACLGLAYLTPALEDLLPARLRGAAPRSPGGRAASWALRALLLSLAAWIAAAPVVLHHFHLASPAALPGNLLLSPLVAFLLTGGFLLLALAPAAGILAAPLAMALEGASRATTALASLLADLPGGHGYFPAPSAAWVWLFEGLLLAWVLARRAGGVRIGRRRLPAAAFPAAAALLAAVGAAAHLSSRPAPGLLVLDVRQGLCSALATEDGRVLVYDCGSYGARDPAPHVAAPALWERGIRAIDLLVLSHPHADHASGVESLCRRFDVRRAAVPAGFEGFPAGARLADGLRARGIPVEAFSRGQALPLGSSAWEVAALHPEAREDAAMGENDRSLVLLARRKGACGARLAARGFTGGRSFHFAAPGLGILWTGDLEEAGTEALLAREGDRLRAEILVIPHHGSAMARTAELAAKAAPRAAVNSARRGFASPGTLDAYRRAGAEVLETWRDGAITVEWESISNE